MYKTKFTPILLLMIAGFVISLGLAFAKSKKTELAGPPVDYQEKIVELRKLASKSETEIKELSKLVASNQTEIQKLSELMPNGPVVSPELSEQVAGHQVEIEKMRTLLAESAKRLNEVNTAVTNFSKPPENSLGAFIAFVTVVVLFCTVFGLFFLSYKSFRRMREYDSILFGAKNMGRIIKANPDEVQEPSFHDNQGLVDSTKDHKDILTQLSESIQMSRNDLDSLKTKMTELSKRLNELLKTYEVEKQRVERVEEEIRTISAASSSTVSHNGQDAEIRNRVIDLLKTSDDSVRTLLAEAVRREMREAAAIDSMQTSKFEAKEHFDQSEERATSFSTKVSSGWPVPFRSRPEGKSTSFDAAGAAAILALAQTASAALRTVVDTERRLLDSTWVELYDDGDMGKFMSLAVGEGHPQFEIIEVVQRLVDVLKNTERLGPLAAEVADPVLRYREACERFRQIQELRSESQNRHSEAFLDELKKATLFLGILRYSRHAREVLRLNILDWAADHFPRLADAFYREYQTVQRRGGSVPTAMQEARSLVDKVLSCIGLRVLSITLGRTPFDDRLHVARSTSSDMSIPDGTIAGVIRNGMEKSDGGWVLQRQAEVVVNRI